MLQSSESRHPLVHATHCHGLYRICVRATRVCVCVRDVCVCDMCVMKGDVYASDLTDVTAFTVYFTTNNGTKAKHNTHLCLSLYASA